MNISDLTFDSNNANNGTERGSRVLEASLQQYGAGRSILLDKNNKIIAGNKTAETAGQIGMTNVKVVETSGDELVAVKRTDLDLTLDAEARELAYADNRTSELSLDWDVKTMMADADTIDLSKFFSDKELAILFEQPIEPSSAEVEIPEDYMILVECASEEEQADRLEILNGMGMACRSLSS